MTAGLLRAEPPPSNGRRALLTCVQGNEHALGARMVADAYQLAGWQVQYLGANVPTSAIIQQVAEWRPDLVGLSVSFAQQLRVVKDIVAQSHARFGAARPAVIVGGLAINRLPELARLVDADAWSADARAAVASGERLINALT
jgi:methanogenic corrinoid protein MtbC1